MTNYDQESSSSFWGQELTEEARDNLAAMTQRESLMPNFINRDYENAPTRVRTTSLCIQNTKIIQQQVINMYEKTASVFKLKIQMRNIDVKQMIKTVAHLEEQLSLLTIDMFKPQQIDEWFYQ